MFYMPLYSWKQNKNACHLSFIPYFLLIAGWLLLTSIANYLIGKRENYDLHTEFTKSADNNIIIQNYLHHTLKLLYSIHFLFTHNETFTKTLPKRLVKPQIDTLWDAQAMVWLAHFSTDGISIEDREGSEHDETC